MLQANKRPTEREFDVIIFCVITIAVYVLPRKSVLSAIETIHLRPAAVEAVATAPNSTASYFGHGQIASCRA